MAKKEVKTDLWVASQLRECAINFDAQGSNVKEINEALKSASKRGTGKAGYPEYVAVIEDFVLVIEDKATMDKQIKENENGILDLSVKAITDYAVNGAYFYAKHIAQNSRFKKIFAVGVSGDEKRHVITPLWVDDREGYKKLPNIESFVWFTNQNISEYYTRYVLEEETDIEKTTEQILKDAAELHEYLRTYGTLKDQDKPLVVAGILLALDEIEYGGFNIDLLTGDQTAGMRDGDKLMNAIRGRLTRSNVGPDVKKDKLLSEFSIVQTSFRLNEINATLQKTPLRYYTEFLYDHIFKNIKYQKTSEDFIGRFYGEFMSYSGGDGQTLGIILTPRHICDLMCELVDIQPNDIVLDPTCGTAGFLISAMHRMLMMADSDNQRKNIKKKQLHGFELQSNMFAVAAANMILRKDGNSNLECCDFLGKNPALVQMKGATVGLMNPPYSQGTKADPEQYELSFIEQMLDSLTTGARAAVIVPQSSMTGKSKIEKDFKTSILSNHTLEGVITCNTDTFYGVGTNPVIALFTAHEPHEPEHVCKFIDFRDDGYEVKAHVGLVEGDSAKDKRQHLLHIWNEDVEVPSKFCVESAVKSDDEWLHSFYYFNDEIPTDTDFERAVGDYLIFELTMVMDKREHLFNVNIQKQNDYIEVPEAEDMGWGAFTLDSLFDFERGKEKNMASLEVGEIPLVSARKMNNGIKTFVNNPTKILKGGNVISLNNDGDGGAGLAYYQPFDFALDTHVTALHPKYDVSPEVLIYMAATISKQHLVFGHGYSISLPRAKRIRIMLPITEKKEPDFQYMNQYIKNLITKKKNEYLSFLG